MIIPKSIAFELNSLASIPNIFMNEIETTNTTELQRLPNQNASFLAIAPQQKITIKHPKIKFSATVKVVFPTNFTSF
jgi:hypothetical protein